MSFAVRLTPTAEAAIIEQARYIAYEQHAPVEAGRWLRRVLDVADTLEEMPRRCPLDPEGEGKPYEVRKLGVDGFMLLFTIVEEAAEVWVFATRGKGMLDDPDRLPPDRATIEDELDRSPGEA